MQTVPYSIYVDKRPLKIAFLVDPGEGFDTLDRVIAYNHGKWGGRYNPIIPYDGTTMAAPWWNFLLAYDPDLIKSFVPFSKELAERVEYFLSPLHVEVPRGDQDGATPLRLFVEGLSILPVPENVAQLCRPFSDKPDLVALEVDESADPLVSRFVRNNFGVYGPWLHVKQALSRNAVRSFTVRDRPSLGSVLEHLSDLRCRIYRAQLCSIPNYMPEVDWDSRLGEAFTVVVGDSLDDAIHAWDRTLLMPSYLRNALSHIWVPTELARDAEVEAGLRKWIREATSERISFVSCSLQREELEDIANRLTDGSWFVKDIQVLNEPPVPVYPSFPLVRLKEGMDLYRAVGAQETMVLKEPDLQGGMEHGERWVADAYVQLKSKLFENVFGKDTWYVLPRRNNLAWDMFHKPARIRRNGLPSVIMAKGDRELALTLLSDDYILTSLTVDKNTPEAFDDPRRDFVARPFYLADRSDKGRYLSGFVDLFSGLLAASHVLEQRYWRRMFDALSGRNPAKDDRKVREIANLLGKRPAESLDGPEGVDRLAEYVLHLARLMSASGKELPFQHFTAEAKEELEEYNAQNNSPMEFNEVNVREAVGDLMERGVLIAGLRSHCPFCGIANWYKVDDVRQVLECAGCNKEFSLRAEATWHYKLNHLVLSGYAYHGLAPVVLVLGQMLMDSRSSFMMSPSLVLHDEKVSDPVCELDVLCVQDGKFVIGEVKNQARLFRPSDFERMREIAVRLRPDKVIFSSLDAKPSHRVTQEIGKLRKALAPTGAEVEWYQLHSYIFEPSPVR